MYKSLKEQYKDKKPCGVYAICNFGGYVAFDIIYGIDDKIVIGEDYGDGLLRVRAHKIYYRVDGSNFIVRNGRRISLDNFMRV